MKNSFLIKSIGKSFDNYFGKRYKKQINTKVKAPGQRAGSFIINQSEIMSMKQIAMLQSYVPKPRDGHTGLMLNDKVYVVFGGDRHHMPFNDLCAVDLSKEM